MGVAYSGSYKELTGVTVKPDAGALAPGLVPANLLWNNALTRGENRGGRSVIVSGGVLSKGAANRITVFKNNRGTGLPEKVIGEIGAPNAMYTIPTGLVFSEDGNYLFVRWDHYSPAENSNWGILYRIDDNEIVNTGLLTGSVDKFYFLSNDGYMTEYMDRSNSKVTYTIRNLTNPIGSPVTENFSYYSHSVKQVTSNTFMFRADETINFEPARKGWFVMTVDPVNLSYELNHFGDTIPYLLPTTAEEAAHRYANWFLPETPHDAYIVRWAEPYWNGAAFSEENPAIHKLDLFAYTNNEFIYLGDAPTTISYPGNLQITHVESTGSAIVVVGKDRNTNRVICRSYSIDWGLRPTVEHDDQLPEYIDVNFNRSTNKLTVFCQYGINTYTVLSGGVKVPKYNLAEPRFFYDMIATTKPVREIYPLKPTLTMLNDPSSGTQRVHSMEFNSANFMDFMSEDGIIEFWWKRSSKSGGNYDVLRWPGAYFISVESSGNSGISFEWTTRDGVTTPSSPTGWGGSANLTMGYHRIDSWIHFAIVRKGKDVAFYLNGMLEGKVTSSNRQNPLPSVVNNRNVFIGNGFLRDVRFIKGKTAGLIDTPPKDGLKTPCFIPPNYEEYVGIPYGGNTSVNPYIGVFFEREPYDI